MEYNENKVKEVMENIAKKIHLAKEIDSVQYIGEHLHYRIKFNDDSISIVPRKYIDDYINSEGKDGGYAIETCLSTSVKSIQ